MSIFINGETESLSICVTSLPAEGWARTQEVRRCSQTAPHPSLHLPAGESLNHRQSPQPSCLLVPRPEQETPVSLYSGEPQVSPITLAQSSTYKSRGGGKGGWFSASWGPRSKWQSQTLLLEPLGSLFCRVASHPCLLGPLGDKWGQGRGRGRALALYPAHIIKENHRLLEITCLKFSNLGWG